jgi:phosphoglycolate phosphatase-like HAD superfamily hydrolase
MTRLVLFDIDNTLLSKSQGHIDAFAVAFYKVYGVYASIFMIQHSGMTDQQIIYEVMRLSGVPDETIAAKIDECMQVMCDYFATVQQYMQATAIDGAEQTLAQLEAHGYLLGLVTGNLEPIGHAKLASAGLDKYFKLGGFGNEAIDRADLVHIATSKATNNFVFEASDNVFLFGDAPQDMQAGVKGGARPIGVTTGIYSRDQLEQAGAYRVVSGVGDAQALAIVTE